MEKKKSYNAVKLAAALEDKEIIEFEKFIELSRSATKNTLSYFRKVIASGKPDFTSAKKGTVDYEMSILAKELQNFLAYKFLTGDRFLTDELFRKALKARGMREMYLSFLSKHYNNHSINKDINHHQAFLLEEEIFNSLITGIFRSKSITGIKNKSLVNSFLEFILLEAISINDNFSKLTLRSDVDMSAIEDMNRIINIDSIIRHLGKSGLSRRVKLFTLMSRMLKTHSFEDYKKFRIQLFKHSYELSKDDNNYFFAGLSDYCILRRKQGHTEYIKEIFILYERMLQTEAFKHSGSDFLVPELFKNIYLSAIKENRLQWGINFVNTYYSYLPKLFQQPMLKFGNARFSFELNDITKAMEYLADIDYEPDVIAADIKVLRIKVQFELGEFEQLEFTLDNFKHYLKETKLVTVSQKSSYRKFLNYVSAFIKLTSLYNKKAFQSLMFQITRSNTFQKSWLLAQLKKLESRYLGKKG